MNKNKTVLFSAVEIWEICFVFSLTAFFLAIWFPKFPWLNFGGPIAYIVSCAINSAIIASVMSASYRFARPLAPLAFGCSLAIWPYPLVCLLSLGAFGLLFWGAVSSVIIFVLTILICSLPRGARV